MRNFNQLSITNLDEFIFSRSPHTVRSGNGLTIGGWTVHPEINFTLPSMQITETSIPEVRTLYSQMITEICHRAVEVHAPALAVEFELLPELTTDPQWGAEITGVLHETLNEFYEKLKLLSTLHDWLRTFHAAGEFLLSKVELRWLERLSRQADKLPENEAQFIDQMLPLVPTEKVRLAEYGF